MNECYKPYDFDEIYEYRTYKNVGKDYGNSKTANLGIMGNAGRGFRRIINSNQKKYFVCNTYTQWQKYVKSVFHNNNVNKDDYLHWLIKRKRYYEIRLETVKIILIPLYIFMLTTLAEHEKQSTNLTGIIMLVEIIMCIWLISDTRKLLFYNDYIEIINDKESIIQDCDKSGR